MQSLRYPLKMSELDDALLPQSYVSSWDDPYLSEPMSKSLQSWAESPRAANIPSTLKSKHTENFIRATAADLKMAYDTEDILGLKRLCRMQQEGLRWLVVEPAVQDLGVAWETWGAFPQSFFFISLKSKTLVGKKRLSPLYIEGRISTPFDAGIRQGDILGWLQSFRCTQERVWIHFSAISASEQGLLFEELQKSSTSIEFPFCALDAKGSEIKSPSDGWSHSKEFEAELAAGEEAFVAKSQQLLKELQIESGIAFDPACSTGVYLSQLKKVAPKIKTIGQDLSKDMIEVARSRLDQVFVGDAMKPALAENSVDLLILRFLNSEVMPAAYAQQIADALTQVLKVGGYAFAFGFTPLLLTAEFFKSLGFEILKSSFYFEPHQAIYPFYLLKKTSAHRSRALFYY